MSLNQHHLIIGASSGLGRALATELSQQGESVILVSRDAQDLSVLSQDLAIRFGNSSFYLAENITAKDFNPASFFEKIQALSPQLKSLNLIAGGSFSDDNEIPTGLATQITLELNFTAPALILNEFLLRYNQHKCPSILIVSSIACIRPRKMNITYTAAKIALESYAQSLRVSFAQRKLAVSIQILRLGYMESIFTEGKSLLLPLAAPSSVAKYLVAIQNQDCGIVYYPKFWWLIAQLLTRMPYFIFKRLNF